MRDAELRFATLRMRIEERSQTARGDGPVLDGDVLRHPGDARVTTTRDGRRRVGPNTRSGSPTASSSGRIRASTSSGRSGRSATGRAGWPTATSPARPASTSRSRRCRPRRCPTRSSTRRATARTSSRPAAARSPARTSSSGREAILLECDHPRTTELAGDRPDFHIAHRGRSRDGRHRSAWSRRSAASRPATPRSSTSRPTRRSSRPPCSSSSRPGRRCSTDERSRRPTGRIERARRHGCRRARCSSGSRSDP